VNGGAAVISAKTLAGFDELRQRIVTELDVEPLLDRPEITNVRHITLVQRAHDALLSAYAALQANGASLSEEFVLADLQSARTALEEIVGRRASEDLLVEIFSRFCIGK
jgi:tRNA modification GTPase